MEDGEKKRPIKLIWEVLFSEDSEPPQLVVERTPAAPRADREKRKLGEMDEADEQSDTFKDFSNTELVDKISRLKKMQLPLPDGGEKLRVNIKCLEEELERRRLLQRQKDDERSKKLAQYRDRSCSGAGDGSSEEAPSSLPTHGSEFATSFCKKMESRTEHVKEDVFMKELSTLNRCDRQRTKSNGYHSSIDRHKGGLPSRKTPFRCPSSLTVNVDKRIPSHGDQKGRCSASPPSVHSKDDLYSRIKMRRSSKARPSNDLKRRNTVVLLDEDEHEIAEIPQQIDQDDGMKEARIYYPSREDPESMEIRYSDLKCLAPEAYMSSPIMNFYIRYLQQQRYSSRKEVDYQFFNTYFYQKLKDAVQKNDKETSFSKVRRWWKGVNLFEKAYIFLPIHERLHWSLVIICIPDKEAGRGPIVLHLDSLGFHSSNLIFKNIKRFLIGEWDFLRKEEDLLDLPIPDKIWDNLPQNIHEKTIEVPQQSNDYDCGLFVLHFIERFIEKAPERVKEDLTMFGKEWFKPEEASSLRHTIAALLKEEFKKAKENNCLLPA